MDNKRSRGKPHFGLGPVGGAVIAEWTADANSKANTGIV
jgi:hypothetical protein